MNFDAIYITMMKATKKPPFLREAYLLNRIYVWAIFVVALSLASFFSSYFVFCDLGALLFLPLFLGPFCRI
jgi:hypothetical protein